MERPVAIVGAGAAGLACAVELERAGVPYMLLEASDRVGGKIKTDKVGGFLLDWGYQTYFDAYPNVAKLVDVSELELGVFKKGAIFVDGNGPHKVESPQNLLGGIRTLFDRSISLKDKLLVAKWTAQLGSSTVEGLRSMGDSTTEAHLKGFGFSEEFMRSFLRPYMGGVFLDKSLSFSRQQFAFLWKMMAEGNAGLPKEGMEAIPRLIAKQLPGQRIRTYSRVAHLEHTPAGAIRGLRLETHESLEAGAIVLACDPKEAGRLLGDTIPADYWGLTTLWFEAGSAPVDGAYLVLNGTGNGIVNNVVPSSLAQASYAPSGSHLVGVMVLGVRQESDDELVELVRKDLSNLVPTGGSGLWRLLRIDRIAEAHLKEPPGWRAHQPKTETPMPGVFLAGDVTTNASIDGAVESGLRAARKAMANLRPAEFAHAHG